MPISLNKMDFYKMDHKNRGYVVIISNFEFTTESIVNDDMFKEGQKKDVENYKELFKALSFKEAEITVYENKTAEEMQNIMKEYANDKDYTDCDCFIAVFLSHGKLLNNEQYIYGTDKSMKFHQNCTDVFKKTETLIKKPKLFFIDICRGKEDEPTCSKSPEHLLANSKIETEKESLESATRYN